MHTDLCDLFGIEYPIFAFTHCRDVVAAVSKAGGLGVLGAVGFSPEQLSTLFRPFTGWAEPGGAQRASLGLGLYLAKEIVSAHGGTIDASSDPGGGARVSIRVPLRRDEPAA